MPAVDVRCPRTTLAPPAPLLAPCHAAALLTSCRGAHLAHSAPRAREERAQCGMLQHRPPTPPTLPRPLVGPACSAAAAQRIRCCSGSEPAKNKFQFQIGLQRALVNFGPRFVHAIRWCTITMAGCRSGSWETGPNRLHFVLRDRREPILILMRRWGEKKNFFSRHGAKAVRGWRRRRAAARLPLFPPPPRPLPSPRSRPGWRATGRVGAVAGAGAAAARRARVAALRERRRCRRGRGGARAARGSAHPARFSREHFSNCWWRCVRGAGRGGVACHTCAGARGRRRGRGGGVGAREGEATKRRLGTKGLPRGRARARLPRGRVRAHGQGSAPFEKRRAHRGSGGGRDARLQAGVGGA